MLLQAGSATLLTVHHSEHAQDHAALALDDRDRFQRRVAGRVHVFVADLRGSGAEFPFDPSPGPVLLGRLPDAEVLYERRGIHARPGDRERDRVGAHGKASDRGRRPARCSDRLESQPPDELLANGGHRGLAGVDVIGGAPARGENEIAVAYRALAEQRRERFAFAHSPPRRNREERNPPFFAVPSPPAAAQKASANSPTVLNRRARSRSRPVITAASIAGGNFTPLTASLRGIGAWVRSCWNSSRGLRPGKGSTPVSR